MTKSRPYVILNAAMTLDGKIATRSGDSKISCAADLDRLHRLRSRVDAVMVGVGTVLADNPSLTVRKVRGRNPLRVVVDGEARTPTSAKVLKGSPTVIAVGSRAPRAKIRELQKREAKVWVFRGARVNLRELLQRLFFHGVRKLLLEGGSTLNWYMLREGLVDEVRVSVAPYIAGGNTAKTLVGGEGFSRISRSVKLRPVRTRRVGRDLLLVFKVVKKGA
jgi:2,5-diamino-6-(ribosylamino)-4(3H)-pyrimidinone 5'-phosphate reductase